MAVTSLWQRITRTDCWVICLLVSALLISLFLSLGRPPGEQVIVYTGEKIAFVGPLNQNRQLEFQGPLGKTEIEIKGGQVRVLASPCPRKICIGMGEVHRSGDLLACVPNRVVVRIEGEAAGGYDLLSR
ncbi:NusG domain II-containing protein [Geopsychrobacter electrodiphilus]|uniref:NusG domain II-containing protein n=1 Tax=Geopsychrobacter electrodiphilus TaxID=225196 RepID=UPI00035E3FE6|nr:NusG domain II-containing protein [Geopsychrobacter electrodiphilus]